MKKAILVFILCLMSGPSFSADTTEKLKSFKVHPQSAGQIETLLKNVGDKNDGSTISAIASVLDQDQAVVKFSHFLVELCLNPQKYGFESPQEDISQCEFEKIHPMSTQQIAEGLMFSKNEDYDAVKIEAQLNNFMNTYLEKVRSIIEAFNDWM